MLYLLVLTDPELSYDNYSEDFYIGLFETEQQAEDIAKHYLKNIKGFCDFPCTYRIVKKDVIGDFNSRISDYLWTCLLYTSCWYTARTQKHMQTFWRPAPMW